MGDTVRAIGGLGVILATVIGGKVLWDHRGTGPGPGAAQSQQMYEAFASTKAVTEYLTTPRSTPFDPWTEVSGRVDQVRSCPDTSLDVCVDMTSEDSVAQTLRMSSACKPYPELNRRIIAEKALGTSYPNQFSIGRCEDWRYHR